MKSLRIRMLVIFSLTLMCSFVAALATAVYLSHETSQPFFDGSLRLQAGQAQRVYEQGGPSALKGYIAEMDAELQGIFTLTDQTGKDLASGNQLSEFRYGGSTVPHPHVKDGLFIVVTPSSDHRYFLVASVKPLIAPTIFAPFVLYLVVAMFSLGWTLSSGVLSPLRHLAETVESFGRGNLTIRVEWSRKDEIGDVGRSFNVMAERIHTLLAAERRLLQDVSHELRSPLARLGFAAELIQDSSDPEAAVERVRREIKRLTELIETLLEVTRAEGEPSAKPAQVFSVDTLVREIVADSSLESGSRQIKIESRVDSSAAIAGDPELFRRAFENVLRNAIRFSPSGSSVLINVKADVERVCIEIRDSGPGVPEEMLTRIFDPFFRVDESRDSSGGGIGLGLSIAKRAVLVHNGQIAAVNACPGLMVTFSIPNRPL